MALATPNMEDCNKKERCLSGPNAGLAYTPGSECPEGYQFDAANCDCSPTYNCDCTGDRLVLSWKAEFRGYNSSCVEQGQFSLCQEFGGADLSTTVTIPGLLPDQEGEWIDSYPTGKTGSCGFPVVAGALKLKRCVNGVTEDYYHQLGLPGCNVSAASGGVTEYVIKGSKTFTISNTAGPGCPTRFVGFEGTFTSPVEGHSYTSRAGVALLDPYTSEGVEYRWEIAVQDNGGVNSGAWGRWDGAPVTAPTTWKVGEQASNATMLIERGGSMQSGVSVATAYAVALPADADESYAGPFDDVSYLNSVIFVPQIAAGDFNSGPLSGSLGEIQYFNSLGELNAWRYA